MKALFITLLLVTTIGCATVKHHNPVQYGKFHGQHISTVIAQFGEPYAVQDNLDYDLKLLDFGNDSCQDSFIIDRDGVVISSHHRGAPDCSNQ